MTVLNAVCEDKMYMHGYWSRHTCNSLTLKERSYNDKENANINAKLVNSR